MHKPRKKTEKRENYGYHILRWCGIITTRQRFFLPAALYGREYVENRRNEAGEYREVHHEVSLLRFQ